MCEQCCFSKIEVESIKDPLEKYCFKKFYKNSDTNDRVLNCCNFLLSVSSMTFIISFSWFFFVLERFENKSLTVMLMFGNNHSFFFCFSWKNAPKTKFKGQSSHGTYEKQCNAFFPGQDNTRVVIKLAILSGYLLLAIVESQEKNQQKISNFPRKNNF